MPEQGDTVRYGKTGDEPAVLRIFHTMEPQVPCLFRYENRKKAVSFSVGIAHKHSFAGTIKTQSPVQQKNNIMMPLSAT